MVAVMSKFAEVLKGLLSERELSTSDLATMTGVSQPTISRYATGKREPSWENVVAIADALGVPLDAFRGTVPPVTKGAKSKKGRQEEGAESAG